MNKLYVIEERYTDTLGKTEWSHLHACPLRHDAIAICDRKNQLWLFKQPYPKKNPPKYRVRLYKAQRGVIKS